MNQYSDYIFDFDGTLVGDNYKIKEGVVELFNTILENNKNNKLNFTICSGSSIQKVELFIDMLNSQLKINYNKEAINFNIIASSGAIIKNSNGEIIKNSPLNTQIIKEIEEKVLKIDPNALILLSANDTLILKKIGSLSKQKLKVQAIRTLLKLKGKKNYETTIVSSDTYYNLINQQKVYNLEILSFSSDLNKQIYSTIKQDFPALATNPGFTVQIGEEYKLDSIQRFAKDLNNAFYIGDGLNDIACLQACGDSYALGNKSKVLKAGKNVLIDIKDLPNILFNENLKQSYESTNRKALIEQAEAEENKKQVKKEQKQVKKSRHEKF